MIVTNSHLNYLQNRRTTSLWHSYSIHEYDVTSSTSCSRVFQFNILPYPLPYRHPPPLWAIKHLNQTPVDTESEYFHIYIPENKNQLQKKLWTTLLILNDFGHSHLKTISRSQQSLKYQLSYHSAGFH